ncbi:uncharacterized membrane protein YcaP (DUF421 family) [Nocardiopsis arvandica]|uniref:Uncharacterized membrane protein YcaP (DUF421 family) n=1 Tax=Nocardiopsis sinuspersici TaxID=501010 RepID=A0A7Z0BLG3_9ACTN|nr:YetF domain-containing protein [Nocardiopsis sinuspersici]NYH55833.1 uncharacterized membrane protein YcaP (DUF421 family) [Nocardiopsis sinuspersici]
MLESLFGVPFDGLLLILVSTVGVFATVITYTRIAGLRSFSKMSSFDFVMTVAVGSLVATVAVSRSSLLEGMTALAALYLLQVAIALLRRFSPFKQAVDNKPLLLMADGTMLRDNMRRSRVTEDDVKSKLRSANVRNLGSVRAVVLETTGDISVLHGPGELDLSLFEDVRDARRIGGGGA